MGCQLRALFVAALLPGSASAGSIGIYSTPNCTETVSSVDPGQSLILYVCANTAPNDGFGDSIDSAEYRILGFPAEWTVAVLPRPGAYLSLGTPLGDGVVIAMPEASGCVLLHTLVISAPTSVENLELTVVRPVVAHAPWGYPTDCPWLHYYCPGPCDTSGVCATGVGHTINPTVDVESRTWSTAKALFR